MHTLMHNFFEAYKHGWKKLDNKAKEELIWFTCWVLPAVQRAWELFASRTTNHRKYLKLLVVLIKSLDCSLKNYKSLPTRSKNQVAWMPGLMMQLNQNFPEINKIPLKMMTRMMMVKQQQLVKQMLLMLQGRSSKK